MNLQNEYITIYTDSDLDSATSNDENKNPNSKLSTSTGNNFPSESDVSSIDSVSNNLSRYSYQQIKCCSGTTICRKCRKTIHWNRHKIVTGENDLNLKTIQDVYTYIYSTLKLIKTFAM